MGIGIRDLKNHLSRHIAEVVRNGTPITITDRGKPVARLAPLEGDSVLEKLIADGTVTRPHGPKRQVGEPLVIEGTVSDLVTGQRE
ncbi:type II toxin-antitoxin system Phd/YefM family antitoxin [Arthrobacter sp. I2-34]|uniref:Antitoxin n=1 Tax=Arthrobacter hankyongi TaxID=2904801 RepID=A0ABS9L379_9MICC|nr:type II toxin-antitoxin system Phd/YefM family antitoxin [Arthrobacter hankyongi]MCG2621100.1 type II toxin-antitoxin system Phd/YefM family antitoxin [Arthrobacter hankyongi]